MNPLTMQRAAMLRQAALRKLATAVLTPEAEQAAVQQSVAQTGMPQPGAPMGGTGMPPGAAPMGAPMPGAPMPPQGAPAGLPPEALQDQGFIQALAQAGVQLDPSTGQAVAQDGTPVPPEILAQAYQEYLAAMQAGQGMTPGAAPMGAPGMAPGGAPMGGPMPTQGAPMGAPGMAPGAGIPPEALQDQEFLQTLAQAGVQIDPATGQAFGPDGTPVPPEAVAQAFTQWQAAGGPQAATAEAQPTAGPDAPAAEPTPQQDIQSMLDSSLQAAMASLEKRLETLVDKLDTLKMEIESLRDTDDMRSRQDRAEQRSAQEDLAAELAGGVKQASAPATPAPTRRSLMGMLLDGAREGSR